MEKWYWANKESVEFLKKGYLVESQTVQDRIRVISDRAEELSGIERFSEKFYDYMSRGWFSLASPIWSNYGNDRGFPVSCFGSYVGDSMESILFSHAENGMLMKSGGGTSGYFGDLRHRGAPITGNGFSSGAVHFMKLFDSLADVVSQGNVRRGFFSAYLPIEHRDAEEFLNIGSDGNDIQGLTTGITVTNKWLESMESGDSEKRKLWAKVLKKRSEHGYPYIMFVDNVNENKPECYKDMPIVASNMCNEISLPSSEDETFVCVLSSMNLLHYEDWKDTDAVETLTIFLDTVVSEFIEKLQKDNSPFLQRVLKFATRHRALGMGVLGWHSYLQSKMIGFESREAAKLNYEIFRNIRERAEQASINLATKFSPVMGTNRRNTTLLAVAPTKSSSFILGQVSQGIEPLMSNYFINNTAKTVAVYKNPYLIDLLKQKGKDTQEVWDSIMKADGSVQHLEFLSIDEKEVFKTFAEINPESIIGQASTRQEFIDQSQSLNLMIPPNMPVKEVNKLYLDAWKMGVKGLYYQFSMSAAQSFNRDRFMNKECAACQG